MLAHVAVLAAVAAVATAPWPLAALAAWRRSRRARANVGNPSHGLTAPGREDRAVTLQGRLAADAPCTSFEGREAAAATVWYRPTRRSRPGEAHVRAGELSLVVDGTPVRLEGPIRVAAGSRETAPGRRLHWLSEPIRNRVHAAVLRGDTHWLKSRVRFRSVRSGETVRVRGRLEQKVRGDEKGGYRDGAGSWRMVAAPLATGERQAVLELVSERPPAFRISAGTLICRAVVTCALLLGLLPWGLGALGEELVGRANDTLRKCDREGRGRRALRASDSEPAGHDRRATQPLPADGRERAHDLSARRPESQPARPANRLTRWRSAVSSLCGLTPNLLS